jgi:hypothetical protein
MNAEERLLEQQKAQAEQKQKTKAQKKAARRTKVPTLQPAPLTMIGTGFVLNTLPSAACPGADPRQPGGAG